MQFPGRLLLALAALSISASPIHSAPLPSPAPAPQAAPAQRLGTVSFATSCAPSSQAGFNRGVALLHDFWYAESARQFQQLIQADPQCAMAHWGLAMNAFHEIWNRPDAGTMKAGWAEMQTAEALKSTPRERAYLDALANFYRPGPEQYPARIDAYSSAMGKVYAAYSDDVDAGAFYALSLLAAEVPNDASLAQQHKAMAVLRPLFAKDPDNPGVVHYIVHACDNPAMAPEGLAAANHYSEIAPDGPHAAHMPGHIYARLGLWPQDIQSQLDSIKASQAAEARGENGIMDEPHSYDFLIYAYLQSGQDMRAKAALSDAANVLNALATMPGGGGGHRDGMVPYYRSKLAAFYALETRDWTSAAALQPEPGSSPEVEMLVFWARTLGDGHLHRAAQARADLARYDKLLQQARKGENAYESEGKGTRINRQEVVAWVAYAHGKQVDALAAMRSAADLQDKVGQGEVDIPAREMLGDMLLDSGHPRRALAEYQVAIKLSPNRLNGLYGAGRAAEAAGDTSQAKMYYTQLLKATGDGQQSARPQLAHAKTFAASAAQTGD